LFACAPVGRVNVVVDGQAELAGGFVSSGNFYQILGIGARAGRTITPDDDRPSAPPVAVISSEYWHKRFGTDPSAVGRVVKVNNAPVTIIGVLPPEFTGVQQPMGELPDIAFPLSMTPQVATGRDQMSDATYYWLQIMGRLKAGATPEQVRGNLEGV